METEILKDNDVKQPVSRYIQRFYCEFCGIQRSKKYLIRSHILQHHKGELKKTKLDELTAFKPRKRKIQHACKECSAKFWKPAHLEQHMRTHSVERPFVCPVENCFSSYRRKDHLNVHLLRHKGKVFHCTVQGCDLAFTTKENMKRHEKMLHDKKQQVCKENDENLHACMEPCEKEDPCKELDEKVDACKELDEKEQACNEPGEKQQSCKKHDENSHACKEPGCGKTFKYASRLKKHEYSHVKVDCLELICGEPNCMKPFTNLKCLRDHIRSCHQYVKCDVCGNQHLKKNLKQRQRAHVPDAERIKCCFEECDLTFSNKCNLNQHVKAVHLELKPFSCGIFGCGRKFSYKHVRDRHEKTHVYVPGDFFEADEQWRSRPRGGRKRQRITIETLTRKRIVSLDRSSVVDNGSDYLNWLLSQEE